MSVRSRGWLTGLTAALALSLVGAVGCSDDDTSTTDGPAPDSSPGIDAAGQDSPTQRDSGADAPAASEGGMADAGADGGMTADGGGAYSVLISPTAVVGPASAPSAMQALIPLGVASATPPSFRDDSPGPLVGCTANSFDRTANPPDLPAPDGDMGTLTISGYSGRGNAAVPIPAMATCMRQNGVYSCFMGAGGNLPPAVPLAAGPASWFTSADMLRIQTTGGANVGPINVTLMAENPIVVTSRLNNIDPTMPLTVTWQCTNGMGGMVPCSPGSAIVIDLQSSDVPQGMQPNKWGHVVCRVLGPPVASGMAVVPAAKLAYIASTPWTRIQATVAHGSSPMMPTDGRGNSIIVSGAQAVVDVTVRGGPSDGGATPDARPADAGTTADGGTTADAPAAADAPPAG